MTAPVLARPTCPVPVERALMIHRWEELTFLHWRYPAEAVQRLLPTGLEVDTRDGSAWVGLVPFHLRIGLPGLPSVRWLSRTVETNVRTYVRGPDGHQGIWFLSLDAARLSAVVVARATYRLPYFWSRMSLVRDGETVTYRSSRRWPGPQGAGADLAIEVGDACSQGELDELDHFLTARWVLYSGAGRRRRSLASHRRWPLHRARVARCRENLVAATGLPAPSGDPLVHFAPAVEVRVGWPRSVNDRSG